MSIDFSNLNWENLSKKTNIQEKKSYSKDERFYTLEVDEEGKGQSLIRLLIDKNSVPFVNIKEVALKTFDEVAKKYVWYIRSLPISIGEKCPLSEFRQMLYSSGKDGEQEAKNFSYKNSYIGNIFVIKDGQNSENDGKVFLWKFGTKLLEKFQEAMQEDNLNPWNPLKEGSNIKLKRKKVSGFPNYDSTIVEQPCEFKKFKNEKEASNFIEENTYELQEFLEKDYYDSYEDLKKSLKYFLDRYKTQNMSQEKFDKIRAEFFGEENNNSYESKTSTKKEVEDDDFDDDFDINETQKPIEDTKKETKKTPTKKQIEDDDIDDLLADLD